MCVLCRQGQKPIRRSIGKVAGPAGFHLVGMVGSPLTKPEGSRRTSWVRSQWVKIPQKTVHNSDAPRPYLRSVIDFLQSMHWSAASQRRRRSTVAHSIFSSSLQLAASRFSMLSGKTLPPFITNSSTYPTKRTAHFRCCRRCSTWPKFGDGQSLSI